MAISDLSVFISTDKDVQLNKKDSTKGSAATDIESTQGGDFFTQLQTAHNSVEPLVKEPNSSKLSELVVVQDKAESTEKTAIDNDAESDSTISGDDMLAQITAANNMDTSVNSTSATNSTLTTQFGSYQEEAIDPDTLIELKTPRPIDKVTPIIDTPLETDELEEQQLKPTLLTEKTVVADAIDKQLQLKGNTPPGDAVTPIIDDLQSGTDKYSAKEIAAIIGDEKTKSAAFVSQPTEPSSAAKPSPDATLTDSAAAIKTAVMADEGGNTKPVNIAQSTNATAQNVEQLIAPDNAALQQATKLLLSDPPAGQKNADPVLANLTADQRQQLQTQVLAIREQGANEAGVTHLKQMLTEFVTLNSQVATKPAATVLTTPADVAELSKQLSLLSTDQKQALSQKLQDFIATEQPKGALLAKISTVIDELAQTNTTVKTTDAKAQNMSTAASSSLLASTNSAMLSSASENILEPNNTVATANKPDVLQSDTKQQAGQLKVASEVQLTKQAIQENGLKDDLIADNAKADQSQLRESATTRVNQLFGQITGLTSALTATAVSEAREQSYQQALTDMQVMHVQQTSPTSTTKQVNLDPTVLQALNIVKSDAAKLLQERVSALLSINNKEAEIRLDPPEMGSMQIRIRSDAEQAHINFVVQNQQAKEALEQSLPRLRELLAQQGIELGESSIQQGNSQAEHGDDAQQNGQGQLANKQQNEQQDSVTQQSSAATGQQSSSSIDYYA
ncbi:flagellar hook-length control protein FliK [Pseudoalteromonas prydzensis]|uniref:flagellar hook-length control protein FliK n=1 Tax=Pseudoalteromonas prydzensis TaxID=182141 RepID=UPI0007E51B69|nr:flagellar hook-length control protein FliK [Pseudoalteromonas prydzensis]MBE0379476.1 flagellar hook-length control protein FliK [Pseudoalteromonas prydzensis ACAM 620]